MKFALTVPKPNVELLKQVLAVNGITQFGYNKVYRGCIQLLFPEETQRDEAKRLLDSIIPANKRS